MRYGEDRTRERARAAAGAYLAYVIVAGIGSLGSIAIQVLGNLVYFVAGTLLYRVLAPADRRAAFVTLPLLALGCAVQSVGFAVADRALTADALLFFGGFLASLGYLVLRSRVAPRGLGVALIAAGPAWSVVLLAGVPRPVLLAATLVGGLSELWLLAWILKTGFWRAAPRLLPSRPY